VNGINQQLYRVLSAKFLTSAPSKDVLPASGEIPEIAFLGRSNVGKSSLLNAICNQRALAITSKTPGRTQAINFFEVLYRADGSDSKQCCHFVDLPGFGFAKVAKAVQRQWKPLVEHYLLERPNLVGVVLLVDCRREPKEEERWLANLGREGNLVIALTKRDKLSRNEFQKQRAAITKALGYHPDEAVGTSLVGKKREGLEELRMRVFSMCDAGEGEREGDVAAS